MLAEWVGGDSKSGTVYDGFSWEWSSDVLYPGGAARRFAGGLSFDSTSAPEPTSIFMLAIGCVFLFLIRAGQRKTFAIRMRGLPHFVILPPLTLSIFPIFGCDNDRLAIAVSTPRRDVESQDATLTPRGLLYRAILPRDRFRAKEPILIKLIFINQTKNSITIWKSGFWPNHLVEVFDEFGREAKLSDEGFTRRQAYDPKTNRGRDKNAESVLTPNESMDDLIITDIKSLYLLNLGNYTLRVTYCDFQGPTPIKITSNIVSFKIE